MTRLALQTWAEALRDPVLQKTCPRALPPNPRPHPPNWPAGGATNGYIPPNSDTNAVAATLFSLMHGLIVMHQPRRRRAPLMPSATDFRCSGAAVVRPLHIAHHSATGGQSHDRHRPPPTSPPPANGSPARSAATWPAHRATGPWPAVVMIHEIFGLDDVMRGHADRLAGLGYPHPGRRPVQRGQPPHGVSSPR